MEAGKPSRTALAAASHRAAHQILDRASIFSDPLALRILGEDAADLQRADEDDPSRRRMRMFIAVRTRFAEDALAAAIARGLRQMVVLGAGLDTYAYRTANQTVRVFEVDHPATQAWKRERLAVAAIDVPASLTFAPIDFERETLAEGLAAAGFDRTAETFFTWLGVVPYLTPQAFWSTIRFTVGQTGGAHVVFDYSNPPESLSPEMREEHERRAARVAELGEAFLNFFDTSELHAGLRAAGLTEIEDLGPREIVARYFPGRNPPDRDQGGHILRARKL